MAYADIRPRGAGGALVVRGDPGIGKTALLAGATTDLTGVTVIRSGGFEAELSMPYAALQRIGLSLSEHADVLTPRQQQALRVAWGIEDGRRLPPAQGVREARLSSRRQLAKRLDTDSPS